MAELCKVDGCTRPLRARGWCNLHYRRWQRSGDPLKAAFERGDTDANFWAKVRRLGPDECWPWLGYITPDGSGKFVWPDGQLAHRFAFIVQNGPIPDDCDVDHRCHSAGDCVATGRSCAHRRCMNGAHIVAIEPDEHKGINKPGVRGKAAGARQRAKTHCPNNHLYDEANTYIDKRGSRNCRACANERSKARYAAQPTRKADPRFPARLDS